MKFGIQVVLDERCTTV